MRRRKRPLPKEVFLSHASRDRPFVSRLAAVFRRHGIRVWYSAVHIVGAQQWHDEIGKALARCDWLLVVLSPHAVKSPWVKRELCYALNRSRYLDHVVPILYKPCEEERLSWTLESYQRVDFTGDYHLGCQDLLRVWGLEYVAAPRRRRRKA